MAFLYLVEGLPMGLFRDVWPVYLRELGAPLRWIGVVSGLYLAWSAKLLWSPLVDRFGERRQWIAVALCTMAMAQLAIPGLPVSSSLLLAVFALFCVASATQDIAIDAYTIGIVPRGREGPANATRVAAYRIAIVLSGAGLLLLPTHIGWAATHRVAAAGLALLCAGLLWCPRVAVPIEARRNVLGAFEGWKGRGQLIQVGVFVLTYRLGDLALGAMARPFWVDAGISKEAIALVSVTFGSLATMVGAAVGGLLVERLGIGRALGWCGVLAVGSYLAYGGAALPGSTAEAIYAASIVESFGGGLAVAAFMSFLMRICDRTHAAVQYATLSGLYALPGTLAGTVSGLAVEQMGYASWFALTALLAAPAFLFLPAASRWAAAVPVESDDPAD